MPAPRRLPSSPPQLRALYVKCALVTHHLLSNCYTSFILDFTSLSKIFSYNNYVLYRENLLPRFESFQYLFFSGPDQHCTESKKIDMEDKEKKRISIILVDKSAEVRKTLKSILDLHQDFEVIAEAENLGLINEILKECVAEVIIIDLNVSEINGILTIKRSKKLRSELSVIVLSLQANLRYMQACIRAGASGYVLLECAFDKLPDAIRSVANGNIYICKELNP